MKLWQAKKVVNALKRILGNGNYDCLEYDEAGSQRFGYPLRIRVIKPSLKDLSSIIETICQNLNKETERSFTMIGKADSTYSIREHVCK